MLVILMVTGSFTVFQFIECSDCYVISYSFLLQLLVSKYRVWWPCRCNIDAFQPARSTRESVRPLCWKTPSQTLFRWISDL